MTEPVIYSVHGNIAVISLNSPPVNGLNLALRKAILESLNQAGKDPDIQAMIIISASATFCGGADIREFGSEDALAYPHLSQLCRLIESSDKLVVAAVDGVALGGGFELALACDYRIATPRSTFGFPEINLGMIPGAGGTQRLPRLASPQLALKLILSGNAMNALQLSAEGVVDQITDDASDLLAAAISYAGALVARAAPTRNCDDLRVDTRQLPENFFVDTRQEIARKSREFFAQEQAIRAVEAACQLPIEEGLQFETELVLSCMATSQARARQHLFFAERHASKVEGLDSTVAAAAVKKIAVIGAGTMGSGIAINFLNAGIATTLVDVNDEALNQGLQRIQKSYSSAVAKGRLSEEQCQYRLALLDSSTEMAIVADADLVIEAVIENMAVKQRIFKTLGEICKPGAILATNTSTLDVNELALASKRPAAVLGMHFFSPANVMRLLEVVRGANTSNPVLATVIKLAKKIGKIPVISGVCWGFIGNRMVEPYGREVARLILEGASPARIDQVLYDFGLPMGLPSMIDMAGIDVGYHARQGNRDALYGNDASYAAIYDALYALGHYGQKSGRGFYIYDKGNKTENPQVLALARDLANRFGVEQREITDREILERTLYTLINEGARVLDDGIAQRAGDIDVVYCYGYGFPSYRGGPMHYADEIGLDEVVRSLSHYRDSLGIYGKTWFSPAPLLEKLAAAGKNFSDYKPATPSPSTHI